MQIDDFMERWTGSGGSEMATSQSFANDLTALLGVEPPKVSDKDPNIIGNELNGNPPIVEAKLAANINAAEFL